MDINWEQVSKALIGKATNYLGGGVGGDYAADAEDLAQDTIIILLEKHEPVSTAEAIKLGTEILRLDCVDHRRVQGRRRELESENSEAINTNLAPKWGGEDPMEVIDADQQIEEALQQLSPKIRSSFEKRVLFGHSYKEIAEAEGIKEDAVRQRVSKARKILENNNNG